MTTEPEALRLALAHADKQPLYFCNKCGYMGPGGPHHAACDYAAVDCSEPTRTLARALISALAVVKAAREYRAAEQRLSPIMVAGEAETVVDLADALDGALCTHDAVLSPASTNQKDQTNVS